MSKEYPKGYVNEVNVVHHHPLGGIPLDHPETQERLEQKKQEMEKLAQEHPPPPPTQKAIRLQREEVKMLRRLRKKIVTRHGEQRIIRIGTPGEEDYYEEYKPWPELMMIDGALHAYDIGQWSPEDWLRHYSHFYHHLEHMGEGPIPKKS